jgi:hypothetical protein
MKAMLQLTMVGLWTAILLSPAFGSDPAPIPAPAAPDNGPRLVVVSVTQSPTLRLADAPDETADPAKTEDQEETPPPARTPTRHAWEMLGDQTPIGVLTRFPRIGRPGGPGDETIVAPGRRYFKISTDESPLPQTREYLSFNYFSDLFSAANHRAQNTIDHINVHNEIFGVEWATCDQKASLGLRLQLNTFNASSHIPELDGTSTDLGDLSIILKGVVWEDKDAGHFVSSGLAITPPTGPGAFAGSKSLAGFKNCELQPFMGYLMNLDPFYVHGFLAFDFPTDGNDVILMDNDLGVGWNVYRAEDTHRFLTNLAPTLEMHLSTPLNHRGVLSLTDKAGTPDILDLTGGVHLRFFDKSELSVGCAVPVTGPRPFDFEILAQFRYHY